MTLTAPQAQAIARNDAGTPRRGVTSSGTRSFRHGISEAKSPTTDASWISDHRIDMPFVWATYLNHITAANPHFESYKHSSLHALNVLLQAIPPGGAPLPAQRQAIIETLGRIPHDKQLKYATALGYVSTSTPLNLPGIPFAYPVNVRTSFDWFEVGSAQWTANIADSRNDGWFHHNFKIEWDSSNGTMADLTNTWHREEVIFLQPPAGPPFNHIMANTANYTFGVSPSANGGVGNDDHYFMHPSLMLLYPLVAGIVRAEQAYQYSPDGGVTWYNMPNGCFTFDKGVRNAHGRDVFVFEKRNDPTHANTRNFHFEVEYDIGPAPANPPVAYNSVWGRMLSQPAQMNTYANVISLG